MKHFLFMSSRVIIHYCKNRQTRDTTSAVCHYKLADFQGSQVTRVTEATFNCFELNIIEATFERSLSLSLPPSQVLPAVAKLILVHFHWQVTQILDRYISSAPSHLLPFLFHYCFSTCLTPPSFPPFSIISILTILLLFLLSPCTHSFLLSLPYFLPVSDFLLLLSLTLNSFLYMLRYFHPVSHSSMHQFLTFPVSHPHMTDGFCLCHLQIQVQLISAVVRRFGPAQQHLQISRCE